VAFVAGGVLLAGGAVLFFTAPSSTESAAPAVAASRSPVTSLAAAPMAGPGSAGVLVQGNF
jgi:hypothetical protein